MYIIWYWEGGQLHRVNCGRDGRWAWALILHYLMPPSYFPWLEYIVI